MKKFLASLAFTLLVVGSLSAQQAKYVFFFIGDGMGINQVYGTQMFLSQVNGNHIPTDLCFTQFPYIGYSKTYSHSNPITDSAAGGTALAVGHKTTNGVIGMDHTKTIALESVAEKAKKAGKNVGVATSVSVDHATPASFYAHQPSRKMAYEIGTQLASSNFDFFAGSDFVSPKNKKDDKAIDLYTLVDNNGYTIVRGYDEYSSKGAKADKVILFQKDGKSKYSLPFAIDRTADDLTLEQITKAAITSLTKNDKGFFVMIEGGQIDWSSHSNDAATTFREVEDMDNAVKIAYDFYKQHPDSTLIVITADHETGGLGMGVDNYNLQYEMFAKQKYSQSVLSKKLVELAKNNSNVTWSMVKSTLQDALGIQFNDEQDKQLKEAFTKSYNNESAKSKSEYFSDEKLAAMAVKMLNKSAKAGWTTSGHSGAMVPVFAIGAGAEQFMGIMENTDIPKKISKAAAY